MVSCHVMVSCGGKRCRQTRTLKTSRKGPIMADAIQPMTPLKPERALDKPAIQAAAAAGKTVATSKAKVAVVPTTASNDIPFPGGAVRLVDGQRLKMLVDPQNGAKVMGGSNWPPFNLNPAVGRLCDR